MTHFPGRTTIGAAIIDINRQATALLAHLTRQTIAVVETVTINALPLPAELISRTLSILKTNPITAELIIRGRGRARHAGEHERNDQRAMHCCSEHKPSAGQSLS